MADAENLTETLIVNISTNATKVSTPEGRAVAYGALFFMAIIPIIIGALKSVNVQSNQKTNGEATETLTHKDAAMFPLIASCGLFSLYVIFKVFSAQYINLLLTTYFFALGVLAVAHILRDVVKVLVTNRFPNLNYHLLFSQGEDEQKEELINYSFDRIDVLSLILSSVVGVWYGVTKHWICNDIFGLAFSINAIELLQLNSISTGCILLGGLFIYDIFWVFGTNVMVFVAKSFEAPIKLTFPQDLFVNGLGGTNMAMLGLGDIVIPGIYIAMLLRMDNSFKNGSKSYFYSGIFAYCVGLALTMAVMHVFNAAQPALLYLVPCCIGIPFLLALAKGELQPMLSYKDNPTPEETSDDAPVEDQKTK